MLIQENIEIEGNEFVHAYSDAHKYIIQNETGEKYIDAVDIPNIYTYIESDEVIPEESTIETSNE